MEWFEYYLRIVAAWALLRLASLLVKDTEGLMQQAMVKPEVVATVEPTVEAKGDSE